jgi:hypothetical protein
VTTSSPRLPESKPGGGRPGPSTHAGDELVAAGMLIMAGDHEGKPLDYDELERWTRVGYERGMRSGRANVETACAGERLESRTLCGPGLSQ